LVALRVERLSAQADAMHPLPLEPGEHTPSEPVEPVEPGAVAVWRAGDGSIEGVGDVEDRRQARGALLMARALQRVVVACAHPAEIALELHVAFAHGLELCAEPLVLGA